MIINDIFVKEIFDSRQNSTIEVGIIDEKNQQFLADIPAGKSRGKNEAVVKSYKEAKEIANNLKKNLKNKNFQSIKDFDEFLLKIDSTSNKEKLGGNLTLGLSLAFSRAIAKSRGQELWQTLRQDFFPMALEKMPLIFSNLINGGLHAQNDLNIQEYLVIVNPDNSIKEAINSLKSFYQRLGETLKKEYNLAAIDFGDEEGYSLEFESNLKPLEILSQLIKDLNLENKYKLGIDAAASDFFSNNYYYFENKKLSAEKLNQIYLDYFKKIPQLYSIEDPFDEEDPDSFKNLLSLTKEKIIIGDDLTVSNPVFIKKFGEGKFINGVIIKPNQVGTVLETCKSIKIGQENNLKIILSHRSGETSDPFVIDFAKACGADGVKIGAPMGSRLPRFARLEEIYSS